MLKIAADGRRSLEDNCTDLAVALLQWTAESHRYQHSKTALLTSNPAHPN
jgi:hypothetical protein